MTCDHCTLGGRKDLKKKNLHKFSKIFALKNFLEMKYVQLGMDCRKKFYFIEDKMK